MRAPERPKSAPARLKRRAEFLRVGKGRRWHGTAMSIQAEVQADAHPSRSDAPRFGFTLTKKVGNAVVRNRARRRLREIVRVAPVDLPALGGHDYVIVGRVEALRLSFDALGRELARGLVAVHERGRRRDKKRAADPQAAADPVDQAGHRQPGRTKPQP